MELRSVLQVIRRDLVIIIVTVVVGLAAAGVVTAVWPATYQTETKVLVEPSLRTSDASAIAQASTLLVAQAPTYVSLATTPSVLDPAIAQSGVDTTSVDLVNDVTVELEPETAVITITVESDTGEDAAKLANGISTTLIEQIRDRSGQGDVGLDGTVVEAPLIPTDPYLPNLPINLAAGFAVGLLVSFVVLAFRQALRAGQPSAAPARTAPAAARPVTPAGTIGRTRTDTAEPTTSPSATTSPTSSATSSDH